MRRLQPWPSCSSRMQEALYSLLVSLLTRSGEIVLTFLSRCLFFYAVFSYRTRRGTASRLFYLLPHPAFGSLFFFTSSPPVFIFEGKKDRLCSEGWGLVMCVCLDRYPCFALFTANLAFIHVSQETCFIQREKKKSKRYNLL